MAKEVVIDGELAAKARRLIGARSAREAAETVLREFVRNGAENGQTAKDKAAAEAGGESQFERLRKSALAVAREGNPFCPGFNHKDLRKNRDAAKDGEGGESSEDERTRVARQHERIFASSLAIARRGSPFYPGFNHKDLRKNRDFG